MKIIAVKSARSIWLMPAILLNPYGKFITPMMDSLRERYGFLKFPDIKDSLISPLALKFEAGSFIGSEGAPIYINLTIHDDGFIAETRCSTDESDRFLEDALSWFSKEYGLPHYSEFDLKKLYVSELVAELDLPMTMFSKKFQKFIGKLEQGISNNPGLAMELTVMHFGPDQEATKKPAPLRVERAVGTGYAKNHFYTASPTPTKEHLELLEAMESAAA